MSKYIVNIDFGSSTTKYLIMKLDGDVINIYKKDFVVNDDKNKIIDDLLKDIEEKNVDIKKDVELVLTGCYANDIGEEYRGIKVNKVEEYTAISYGTLLLLKLDKALIANIGTGTCYMYSDLDEVLHLGGSGMGGGAIMGIGKKIYKLSNMDEIIDKAKNGNRKNADLFISDITTNKSLIDLGKDLTASNLTKVDYDTNEDDFVISLYNLICQNLGIEAIFARDSVMNKKNFKKEDIPIVFTGGILQYDLIRNLLDGIANDLKEKFLYVDETRYITVIGAYEYYLLRERKNF